MTTNLDLGARCDRHVGEAFQVRCPDCDAVNRELEQEQAQERHQRALERNAALGLTDRPKTVRRRVWRQR